MRTRSRIFTPTHKAFATARKNYVCTLAHTHAYTLRIAHMCTQALTPHKTEHAPPKNIDTVMPIIVIFLILFSHSQPDATYLKRFSVSAGRVPTATSDEHLKRVRRALTLESTLTYLGKSLNNRSMFTIVADDTSTSSELEGELEQSRSLLKQQSTFVAKMVCCFVFFAPHTLTRKCTGMSWFFHFTQQRAHC